MEGFLEDLSATNPEAYSASLANVVSVWISLVLFLYPGSHVDGVFPPRPRCRYRLKERSSFSPTS